MGPALGAVGLFIICLMIGWVGIIGYMAQNFWIGWSIIIAVLSLFLFPLFGERKPQPPGPDGPWKI